MKQLFALFVGCMITAVSFAQSDDPVNWSFAAKKISGNTYEVTITATIEDEWHIYSQNTPKGGPVATEIRFNKNPLVTVGAAIVEKGKLEKRFEPLFNVEVMQFSDKVEFVQQVTLKAAAKTALAGSVKYMTCNDHECMPPKTKTFSVSLN